MSLRPSGPRAFTPPRQLTPEERLFMARLAGLNAAFEAARAGTPGRAVAAETRAVEEFLERCYLALTQAGFPTPAA